MTNDLALQLMSQLLWHVLLIAAPVLGLTMVVGILVSIFQVITQIQDVSLSFIPKMFAVAVVLAVCGPWMLKQLVGFATVVITQIPTYL
jgi:flagellar biosynthetic protein FliQ